MWLRSRASHNTYLRYVYSFDIVHRAFIQHIRHVEFMSVVGIHKYSSDAFISGIQVYAAAKKIDHQFLL